ncbi:MAG: AMP-binding protein [Chloroflexi bacterium]|nr:AMP-binding protein [Chloroflexota bacterium]
METKRRFDKLTGGSLVEGFGMTETFVATHCNPIKGESREGSIGLPLPNVECRIVDAVSGEEEMPVGEIGELIIKGPTVMKGYWNMPTKPPMPCVMAGFSAATLPAWMKMATFTLKIAKKI